VAVGRRRRIPVVVSEHHTDFVERLVHGRDAAVARRVFRRAARVCAVGQALGDAIAELEPRARVEVLPNPVDLSAFTPAEAPPPGEDRLLCVAMLSRQKGVDDLLRAIADVRGGRPVRLDVIGDGPERPALEALAADLVADGAVRFLGARPKEEVAAAMRASDGFVLPSVVETFGVVAAEALACGVPTLVTDSGGIAEVVAEAGGVVVAPRDPSGLARGIETLLAGAADFDRARAARLVRERYSPDTVARRWDEVYRAVAGS
jgi:glycosyltransferase involved in cell wall biosynthesis